MLRDGRNKAVTTALYTKTGALDVPVSNMQIDFERMKNLWHPIEYRVPTMIFREF